MKKSGVVLIVGRPNSGKSTLLNNLLKQKVAITSPKPQTTRFPIDAVYEDERGQIIFTDTPGIFTQSNDMLSRSINANTIQAFDKPADLILYLIDFSKKRDSEENKILGLVRKAESPKILVVNKIDIPNPKFSAEYAFYENEFPHIVYVSALTKANLNLLLNKIYELLPIGKQLVDTKNMVQPGLNLNSSLFISEIIREKVFLFTHDELPYTVKTSVEEIAERSNNCLYIRGKIITTSDQYKKMLIGKNGAMIKKIGMAVRKELETSSGKKVFTEITVETDPDWQSNI